MRGWLVVSPREVSSTICPTRAIGSVTRFSFKLVSHLCVFPDHSLRKRSLQVCFRRFPEFSFSRTSNRIFENVTAKWTFCVQQFCFSKIAIIETKTATIASFSSPPFFLLALSFFFSFPFPSLVWVRSLTGPRNPLFNAFSLKWRQILLGWFSKNRWQS